MPYVKKYDPNYPDAIIRHYDVEEIIHDKIMYEGGDFFSDKRNIEDQIEQCVKIMGKLIDHLGIDASIFNDDFIKDE